MLLLLFMFNAIFLEPNSLVSMISWWSWKMRFWYLSMYWNLQVQRMELIPGIRLCAWIYRVYTCMFGSLLDLVWGLGLWCLTSLSGGLITIPTNQINNINCGQNIAPTHTNNPHITKANKHTFSHLQVLLRLIHKIVNRLVVGLDWPNVICVKIWVIVSIPISLIRNLIFLY
jgi:hypothetical protein